MCSAAPFSLSLVYPGKMIELLNNGMDLLHTQLFMLKLRMNTLTKYYRLWPLDSQMSSDIYCYEVFDFFCWYFFLYLVINNSFSSHIVTVSAGGSVEFFPRDLSDIFRQVIVGRDSHLRLAFRGVRRSLEKRKTAIIDRSTNKIFYYFLSFSFLCRKVVLGTASFFSSFPWITCSITRRSVPGFKKILIFISIEGSEWCTSLFGFAPRISEIANYEPVKVEGIMHLRSSNYRKKWIF